MRNVGVSSQVKPADASDLSNTGDVVIEKHCLQDDLENYNTMTTAMKIVIQVMAHNPKAFEKSIQHARSDPCKVFCVHVYLTLIYFRCF